MAEEKSLQLVILTQEQKLLEKEVYSVTVETSEGEITVLPDHIPLFSKLAPGELRYRSLEAKHDEEDYYALSGGFLDVSPDGVVTVLADSAIRVEDIDVAQAQAARERAVEAMKNRASEHELRLAEGEMRRVMNELRLAQKRQKGGSTPRF